jgi:hypothetical protein
MTESTKSSKTMLLSVEAEGDVWAATGGGAVGEESWPVTKPTTKNMNNVELAHENVLNTNMRG